MKRHDLSPQADVAAAHASFFDQLPGDEFRGVDGGGETDSLRLENDSGVDADHLAARVDEWPAGIARIQRRVGLNDVFNKTARLRTQRAAESDDQDRGECILKT